MTKLLLTMLSISGVSPILTTTHITTQQNNNVLPIHTISKTTNNLAKFVQKEKVNLTKIKAEPVFIELGNLGGQKPDQIKDFVLLGVDSIELLRK
ncbi:hypothetical protein [Williamsoniiplasma luminosum]|uniref:Uncharacterized protein n=1 Tax=Williamsoniiplasma luminosum TaxID=214888 RepID=A0A2S0NJS8_9MOLU|nr:hypothetical protein [Williamsoniiplasma luminosum]AVP49273.1 MAG: hypothetical protein C5T88_01600 [Williamsoniiplasma luminosum]